MVDQNVLARLHLSAVLQNLEEVVAHDAEAGAIARDWNHVLQFSCPGGIGAHVEFGGGRARVTPGTTSWPQVALWLPSATQLNHMFMGEGFALPIPWSGPWRVGLLKGFAALSKRMEHYLRPDDATLADRKNFEFHTKCLLYTAVFGLKEVGEYDAKAAPSARSAPDGVAEFRIKGGPSACLVVKGGKLFPKKGAAVSPNAVLEFEDYDAAFGVLSGKSDAMALMGSCRAKLAGRVPLIDKLNAALDRLAVYLN
ncbi:MAG: hypothetical protein M5R36_20715 [Deltaproteobacteria bacterium]|nr:hypothetical protein [Deltaproteobacteria bacterium]